MSPVNPVGLANAITADMKFTKAAFILSGLFWFVIQAHAAAGMHTVKGVVITPDGTVVPEFSVIVREVSDAPELFRRKHFKNGEFTVDGLNPARYQLQVSSPQFIRSKLIVDLRSPSRATEYEIVILHPYRNELRIAPGAAYQVSVKTLQQKVPDAAREAYTRGVAFHREGQLDAALIEYGRALRSYPRYAEALTDIGAIFLLYNRPQSALTFLNRARNADESNPIINLNIAIALAEQGDHSAALKLLKKILDREPRMAQAQSLTGKIHYLQKNYDEAETYLRQALESDPTLLEVRLLMININVEQQKYDEAREGLRQIRATITNQMVTEFIDEQLSALGG